MPEAVARQGPTTGSASVDGFTPGRDLWGLLLDVGRAKLIDANPDEVQNTADYTDVRTSQAGSNGGVGGGLMVSPLLLLVGGAVVVYLLTSR